MIKMSEENIKENRVIEERTDKLVNYIKSNPQLIFYVVLAILVILGVYIRYLPLTDHGGKPGLWDITTNDYTLGPDLDPFLFLRYAKDMINNGSLAQMDNLRYVPLGFDTTTELEMVSHMIVLTYRMVNVFGKYSVNYAGAFMPVWIFGLTIIAFFLFVREIFLRKHEKESLLKANLIASISTLFMVILPGFLSRTVAGIPEKESVGFFFMFLAFYLFLKAWKAEKIMYSGIFGILAGISTGIMGLAWGGVTYVYVTIGLACFAAFILNKFEIKHIVAYCLWIIAALFIQLTFTNRFSLKSFFLGFDTGLACITLIVSLVHLILWKTTLGKTIGLEKIKLPKTITSLIIVIILGILASFAMGPTYLIDRIVGLNDLLIKPLNGRWSQTVAENAQPYLTNWASNFGQGVFWLFLAGSILLFNKTFNKIEKRDRRAITVSYVIFLLGLIFSRYAPHPSILDGENFISKFLYYGSALLMLGIISYLYIKYHKAGNSSFENIEFEYLFLFALFVLTLFTARSAVRLIMVLVPIAPIFLAYLMVELGFMAKGAENKDARLFLGLICAVVILTGIFAAFINVTLPNGTQHQGYLTQITQESYNYVPYYYTFQWQEAMSWVRNNTPTTAVFAHWWDYGYWVQSIGNRATVTDGGNNIVWWNYLTGRYVLTGDNQKDSLDFLYNHNATHLLIDSSDIGKYGAFSQIGSDANYDRFSYGPITLVSDAKQVQETANGSVRIYQANSPVDEDIMYNDGNSSIFIPGASRDSEGNLQYNAAVIGMTLETQEINGTAIKQPNIAVYYQGQQINLPVRYVYFNGKILDYKKGLNASISLIEKVDNNNGQLSVDRIGAAIYLSPRVFRGLLGQIYILNDSLGTFPNYKLVHSEPDYIIGQINNQKAGLGDFVYYQGLRGPIKIWSINYTGEEKFNEDYLRTTPPSSITWKF